MMRDVSSFSILSRALTTNKFPGYNPYWLIYIFKAGVWLPGNTATGQSEYMSDVQFNME